MLLLTKGQWEKNEQHASPKWSDLAAIAVEIQRGQPLLLDCPPWLEPLGGHQEGLLLLLLLSHFNRVQLCATP